MNCEIGAYLNNRWFQRDLAAERKEIRQRRCTWCSEDRGPIPWRWIVLRWKIGGEG